MTLKKSVCVFALGGLGMAAGCRTADPAPYIVMPTAMPSGAPVTMLPSSGPVGPAEALPAMPRAAEPPNILPAPKPEKSANKYPRGTMVPAIPDGPDLPPVVPPRDLVGLLPAPKSIDTGAAPILPLPKPVGDPPLVSMPKEITPPTAPAFTPPAIKSAPVSATPTYTAGHDPDFRWVTGTLDRHARGGYWTIRYMDRSNDDRWGGKVRLLDDSRLRDFHDGDTVYVEGELLAPASAADGPTAFPPFRVSNIRLVEKAK